MYDILLRVHSICQLLTSYFIRTMTNTTVFTIIILKSKKLTYPHYRLVHTSQVHTRHLDIVQLKFHTQLHLYSDTLIHSVCRICLVGNLNEDKVKIITFNDSHSIQLSSWKLKLIAVHSTLHILLKCTCVAFIGHETF